MQPDGFDLQSLNEELTSMTLIRALPAQEYSSFTLSLLLKNKLDKAAVHQAFVTEDIHCRRRAVDIPNTSSIFYTISKAPKTLKSQVTWSWCNKPGHEEAQCNRKDRDCKRAQENTQFHSKRCPHNANKTQEEPKDAEFAGNASARSIPSLSPTPLQLNADFHWLADTGATSHMTPHRHWFKSYTHYRTLIRLANNSVIFSAGVGNVVFEPIVNGKRVRAVEFSRVLHVPDLRSNLLSCLYLTRNKGFTIFISSHTMVFSQDKLTLFTASIDSTNSAVLNGSTIACETAFPVSTLPADLSLWH